MANGTIAFDTLTTSDSVKSNTEKSIDTSYIFNGVNKVWVNFNGSASGAASNDSLNVSGMTDNGTGDTTISMTNSMGDADYIQIGNSVHNAGVSIVHNCFDHDSPSTSSNVIMNGNLNSTGAANDGEHQMVIVHGDLA